MKKFLIIIRKALHFGFWGALGGAVGSLVGEYEQTLEKYIHVDNHFISNLIDVAIWMGISGAGVAVAIYFGNSIHLKRKLLMNNVFITLLFGFLAGAAAGAAAQGAYAAIGPTETLRVICWGISGGLLGLMLSFRIINLGCWRGLLGGLAGGALGGYLFIVVSMAMLNDMYGRIAGCIVIGLLIGAMIVIAEAILREAWLEVTYAPREVRMINLGATPVTIGGDSRQCDVCAPNAAGVVLRYYLRDGQVFREDGAGGTQIRVHPGDVQTVGRITVTVCASRNSSPKPRTVNNGNPALSSRPVAAGATLSLYCRGKLIPLSLGTSISAVELPGFMGVTGTARVAEVVRNPQDPSVIGLKNLTDKTWRAVMPDGANRVIEPSRSLRLAV